MKKVFQFLAVAAIALMFACGTTAPTEATKADSVVTKTCEGHDHAACDSTKKHACADSVACGNCKDEKCAEAKCADCKCADGACKDGGCKDGGCKEKK